MVKIKEAILVEGRYDKNTLSQIVDAPILETNGFGIFILVYLHRYYLWCRTLRNRIACIFTCNCSNHRS